MLQVLRLNFMKAEYKLVGQIYYPTATLLKHNNKETVAFHFKGCIKKFTSVSWVGVHCKLKSTGLPGFPVGLSS